MIKILSFLCFILLFTIVNCDKLSKLKTQSKSKEVFGFTKFVPSSVYKQYDLKKITVLVFLDQKFDKEFLQYAKDNNVRTYLTGRYPVDKLDDLEFRTKWFKDLSTKLQIYDIKGLHLEFNEPIAADDPKRGQLTDLVKYLKSSLSNQYNEFSMSVPWSPINKKGTATFGMNYDFVEIAKNVDYLLINGFHINAQQFVGSEYDDEVCLAKANMAFIDLAAGLMKWLTLNETQTVKKFYSEELMNYHKNDLANTLDDELNLKSKIILVYPWFGIDYTCKERVERQRCILHPIPFIDANCSDKGAEERTYGYIWNLIVKNKYTVYNDPHSRSSYLEFKDENNKVHQLWFDYYYDYTLKYYYINQFDIRGMGIMALDYQDYSDKELLKTTNYMWSLIPKLKN